MKNLKSTLINFISLLSILCFFVSCMKENKCTLIETNSTMSFFVEPDKPLDATRSGFINDSLVGSVKLKSLKSGNKDFYLNISEKDWAPVNVSILRDSLGNVIQTRSNEQFDFLVTAYYNDGQSGSSYSVFEGIENKLVTFSSSDNYWKTADEHQWPGSGKMLFYANNKFRGVNKNKLFLTSIPPNDFYKDLLVAKSEEISKISTPGKWGKPVELRFKHALSAIQFKTGKGIQNGKITKITLKNIYRGVASYSYDTGEWSVPQGNLPVDYVLDNLNFSTIEGEDGQVINEKQMLLLPQILLDDSQIIIEGSDEDGNPFTLSANLQVNNGTKREWRPGKVYTYTISNSSIIQGYSYRISLTGVGGQEKHFEHHGGTGSYNITAYRQKGNIYKPSPWYLEYSTDGGKSWSDKKPDWVKKIVTKGKSSKNNPREQISNLQYEVYYVAPTESNTRMRQHPYKGTKENPWNLSNSQGAEDIQNTANCYIVDAAGYYKFPLVYGNAYKNGKDNKSAYMATNLDGSHKTGDNILEKFINHYGNAITSPFIVDNSNCVPRNVELVWSDALDIVSDIEYDPSGKGWIKFYVDPAIIQEGNALISIKDPDGYVLWSWHIWVTDQILGKDNKIVESDGQVYYLMNNYLGGCDAYYQEAAANFRHVLIRACAGDQKTRNYIAIDQLRGEKYYGDNCTYYQWGRKDPFPGGCGIKYLKAYDDENHTYNKIIYKGTSKDPLKDNPGNEWFSTGNSCIIQGILKPNTINQNPDMDSQYYNLWNIYCDPKIDYLADNLRLHKKVIKTVYDPSPIGYVVPVKQLFKRFSDDGVRHHHNLESRLWGYYNDSEKAFGFYPANQKSGGFETLVKFYLVGVRTYKNSNIDEYYEEKTIHCWYDSPIGDLGNDLQDSYGFSIRKTWLYNDEGDHRDRGWAWPVRPMREN